MENRKKVLKVVGKEVLCGLGGVSGILLAQGFLRLFLKVMQNAKTAKEDALMQEQGEKTEKPSGEACLCTGPICGTKPLADRVRVSRTGLYCSMCYDFDAAQQRKKFAKFAGPSY